jgi:hypothetical protein
LYHKFFDFVRKKKKLTIWLLKQIQNLFIAKFVVILKTSQQEVVHKFMFYYPKKTIKKPCGYCCEKCFKETLELEKEGKFV